MGELDAIDYACNQGSRSLVLGNFFLELEEKESGVVMDGFRFRHATGSNRIITFLCR